MNPSGGGIGKAAQEMMKEMQRTQQQEMQQLQDQNKTGGSQGFQQHLQAQQTQGPQQVSDVQKVQETQKAQNILQQARVNQEMPSTRVGAAAKAKSSKVASLLQGLVQGQDKMKHIMKLALSGRKMQPQELLALQAGVYRFSQELELTSKVVEKATGGIKQTMNTQV